MEVKLRSKMSHSPKIPHRYGYSSMNTRQIDIFYKISNDGNVDLRFL